MAIYFTVTLIFEEFWRR